MSKCLHPIERFRIALEVGKSPHTVAAYVQDATDLQRFLARHKKDLLSARAGDLDAYLTDICSRLSANSCVRRVAGIKKFYRFALRAELVSADPSRLLAARRPSPPNLSVPSVRKILELLEAPPASSRYGLRDRAILELLYGAGLRVSELTCMNLDSTDFKERMLRVMGKRSRERMCPINRPALEALSAYLVRREEFRKKGRTPSTQALFLNQFGGRITRNTVLKLVWRWARAVGLPASVGPHTLRHAFATHMVKAGAKLDDVKELLGHNMLRTTQRYVHVELEDLQRVYRKAHPRALPSIAPTRREPCGMARCDGAQLPAEIPALSMRNAVALTVRWSAVDCSAPAPYL